MVYPIFKALSNLHIYFILISTICSLKLAAKQPCKQLLQFSTGEHRDRGIKRKTQNNLGATDSYATSKGYISNIKSLFLVY